MKFFVTTPIYYVNDIPHIGHAYTTVAADILARYWRMRGAEAFFLTGTDEHGQKVEKAARERGLDPKAHADSMVGNYKALWETLGISNTAFIRTTDEGHKKAVRDALQRLFDKGEIEKRSYKGLYCTPCERFWTEKDLKDGKCPECGREVEGIDEENYFFLMSKYSARLIEHIEKNPFYILPESRKNEVLGFLRTQELGDLCISRPKKRLAWGIPLPFDENYVTYVWFDALINYYSATLYLAPKSDSPEGAWWPASHHIIGKDILTTHAVYWSAMLMAMDMPLPRNIFAHGWWTVEGRKMSKSFGNVVSPVEMCAKYGPDAFRYFMMREVTFGLDGDFSEAAMVGRINTELANDLGNLASRALSMIGRYSAGIVPKPDTVETEMKSIAEGIDGTLDAHMERLQFPKALDEIWRLVSYANKYIDSSAPWALAKDPALKARLDTVLYSSAEALRFLAIYLYPYMPVKCSQLWEELGLSGSPADALLKDSARWGGLKPGTRLGEIKPIFPRIETEAKQEAKAQKKKEEKPKKENTQVEENIIGIEDFAKVVLKTGKILSAERVEGSEKLIKLKVDTGEERQIVAGIGKAYAPEELLGMTVAVVCNLKPAKLMGVESQGMLLAATGPEGKPIVLSPHKEAGAGWRIK